MKKKEIPIFHLKTERWSWAKDMHEGVKSKAHSGISEMIRCMNSGWQAWKGHLELDSQESCTYGVYPEGSGSGSHLCFCFK